MVAKINQRTMNLRNHNRNSNASKCVKQGGIIAGGIFALLFVSCADVVYDKSVDVNLSGWTSADSLFFPIIIQEEADAKNPVLTNRVYSPTIQVRFSESYPFTVLPFCVKVEKKDSLGIYRRQERYWDVRFPLTNADGYLTGTAWGSTFLLELPAPKLQLRFDEPGDYRVVVLPALDEEQTMLEGVSAIGMRF